MHDYEIGNTASGIVSMYDRQASVDAWQVGHTRYNVWCGCMTDKLVLIHGR